MLTRQYTLRNVLSSPPSPACVIDVGESNGSLDHARQRSLSSER